MPKPTTRQEKILELVQRQGYVSVEALAQRFDMTPQTIRRDINQLSEMALVERYHGGAGVPSSVENVAYTTRQVLCLEEKRRIAQAVAAEIPDHASLFINIGTTTEEVAKELLGHKALRIITNNLNVASILCSNPDFEVIVAGGLVRGRDRGIIGEPTIDLISQFKVDYGIIGISGIDSEGVLLDFDYREVRVAQAIHRQFPARVPRRRPYQVRPQRHGPHGPDRTDLRAVYGSAASGRHPNAVAGKRSRALRGRRNFRH